MLSDLFKTTAPLPRNARRLEIPRGHLGTVKTVEHMAKLALTGARDPRIRAKAINIIKGNEGIPAAKDRDFRQYADRLFRFVQKKIHYVHDPVDVELLEDPYKLLELGGGDCDSVSILLASLAMAAGLRADYVTIKADAGSDEWSHVYTRIHLPDGTIVPCDCTMKKKPSGWEPKGYTKKIWPISSTGGDPNGSDQSAPQDITDTGTASIFPADDMKSDDNLFSGAGGEISMNGLSGHRRMGARRPRFNQPHKNFVKSMAGMSGILEENTLVKVLDGSLARELGDKRREMNIQTGKLFELTTAAEKIADPARRAQAMQVAKAAQESHRKYKDGVYAAIAEYNKLAQNIQTYSFNALKPTQLGFLPAAAIPLLKIGAVLAGLSILANLIGAIRGNANATEGYISQLSRLVQASGGAIEQTGNASVKFAYAAAIGVALFFGVQFLKKKGTI